MRRVLFLWRLLGPAWTRVAGYLPLDVYRQWRDWCRFQRYFLDDPQMKSVTERFDKVRFPIVAVNRWTTPGHRRPRATPCGSLDTGIKGFDAMQWYVIATPRGVPADVLARLNGWIKLIAASAEMQPALLASGSVAGQHTARETQEFVDADTRRWKELAVKAKLDLQ